MTKWLLQKCSLTQRRGLGPLFLLCLAGLTSGCGEESRLPDPYRTLAVPEELTSPEARRRGRVLYVENCVLCHGERADGRGVRHDTLVPPPRDYADPAWRAQATPRSVYYALAEGIQGTAMPAWNVLDSDQLWDLTAYVLSVADHGPYVEGLDEAPSGASAR